MERERERERETVGDRERKTNVPIIQEMIIRWSYEDFVGLSASTKNAQMLLERRLGSMHCNLVPQYADW
jgi:hypothetical protein